MKIQVQLFATFRELFQAKAVEVKLRNGAHVGELLDSLFNTEERRGKIFDHGKLKPFIIIFKNGRHIQHLDGLETELREGDSVAIFPPIAGG